MVDTHDSKNNVLSWEVFLFSVEISFQRFWDFALIATTVDILIRNGTAINRNNINSNSNSHDMMQSQYISIKVDYASKE